MSRSAPDQRSAGFDVPSASYDRLMGRYLPTLGPAFAAAAGVVAGQRALDVGCGPGGLTTVLAERLGADRVAAVDPSAPFVAACRDRNPGVDVREGVAEQLPWPDATFDVSLASLVVGFVGDPVAGVTQMRRVVRGGGRVAASFWAEDEMPLLGTFWRAVNLAHKPADGEAGRLGRRAGDLEDLLDRVGLVDVVETRITGTATYADLDDWWSSFTGGAGPVGAYLASLTPEVRTRVRAACEDLLDHPEGEFSMEATAWCAVGTVLS